MLSIPQHQTTINPKFNLELHEVANIFPEMNPTEFNDLKEDIKKNGLLEPIWLYQGKIIDGRHRYRACQELGIEPRIREWLGNGGLMAFVISLNLKRRHLTQEQKAFAALNAEKIFAKEAAERQKAAGGNHGNQYTGGKMAVVENFPQPPTPDRKARDVAARVMQVNSHYVSDAKKVRDAAPELEVRVIKGDVSLRDAAKVARLPEETRRIVVERIVEKPAEVKVNDILLDLKKEEVAAQATSNPDKPLVYRSNYREWMREQPLCDLLLTDPPYMTDVDNIQQFANDWLPFALSRVKPSGRAYVFIGAYPEELRAYLNVPIIGMKLANILVWTYKNTIGPSPKEDYKTNWQAVLYYRGHSAKELDAPILTEKFTVQEFNAPDGRLGERYHTWQKPDRLAEMFIRHSTRPGDLVLDPFTCTGTFVLAAQRLGRVGRGCDISHENLLIAKERGCKYENKEAL